MKYGLDMEGDALVVVPQHLQLDDSADDVAGFLVPASNCSNVAGDSDVMAGGFLGPRKKRRTLTHPQVDASEDKAHQSAWRAAWYWSKSATSPSQDQVDHPTATLVEEQAARSVRFLPRLVAECFEIPVGEEDVAARVLSECDARGALAAVRELRILQAGTPTYKNTARYQKIFNGVHIEGYLPWIRPMVYPKERTTEGLNLHEYRSPRWLLGLEKEESNAVLDDSSQESTTPTLLEEEESNAVPDSSGLNQQERTTLRDDGDGEQLNLQEEEEEEDEEDGNDDDDHDSFPMPGGDEDFDQPEVVEPEVPAPRQTNRRRSRQSSEPQTLRRSARLSSGGSSSSLGTVYVRKSARLLSVPRVNYKGM